ncbi:MAG: HlyD family secretion protein, partial [Cyanobacteria bacterium SIG32]|nr:HlyD family secretion protein [Cyanobacteria bacterium SIG32]
MEEKEIQETQESKEEKRKVKKPAIIVMGLIVAGLIAYFVIDSIKFQSTDDAYVETTTVSVSPKVSGQIVEVLIKDNQFVKEGDLVARIDDTDYKVKVDQVTAQYERTLLDQENAKANFKAADTNIDVAKKDLERYTNLYEAGAVSKQTLDSAQAKYDAAKAQFTRAEQSVFSTNDSKVADADLKVIKAQKEQAELNLSYTNVYAPQSGTVASRRVEKGMYVQVGTPLFTIVPEEVWVVANFKENQLRHMKAGQEVDIKIDTYPNKTFKGKIDSIQRSSGAKSSLFPPENAVGSFVKIVQRIPVKIVFTEEIDPEEFNIVPGMSVVPKV